MLSATKKDEILRLSLSILKITPKKVYKGPWAVLGRAELNLYHKKNNYIKEYHSIKEYQNKLYS